MRGVGWLCLERQFRAELDAPTALAVVDHEIRRIAEGGSDTTIGSVGGSTQVAAAEDVVALQRGLFVVAEEVAAEERAEVDEIKKIARRRSKGGGGRGSAPLLRNKIYEVLTSSDRLFNGAASGLTAASGARKL